MSSSGQATQLKLVTVGDFDPHSDRAIEYDFIGRVIAGRYTVLGKLGGGGMADVYRATDGELGIEVAIKLLKPRMASDELRARMVQEAQAAAQVRHSNLVRVYGTGKLDATAYIVMEMLDGPNLEQYLREYPDQRLPWKQALELLLPALEALHAVHERGYVHRDIKPGNILVTCEPGCPPTAIVIDLGLVKPDRALRNGASPPTTETGRMLCTPGYTSPEQAAGLPVDRRSDVYSMAITLYRVLAGRLPFHDARGQAMFAVLAKHIYNEPTMLAEAAVGAEIPPGIAAVIESGLRKKPGERPQTMLAFAEALRVAAAEVPAEPVSSPRRRPHGLVVVLAAMVVLAWVFVPGPASPIGMRRELEGMLAPMPRTWVVPGAIAEDSRSDETLGPMPVVGEVEAVEQEDPVEAARRVLGRRGSAVQRCVDATNSGVERLRVAVTIDGAGRVLAHVVEAEDTPLSRCVAGTLRKTRLAAPEKPLSFVQTFQLRGSARRP
jgi:serine/threonine-protein kinase